MDITDSKVPEGTSFRSLPRRWPVCLILFVRAAVEKVLTFLSRTLIFDIFRLNAMIRLVELGPDITCKYRANIPFNLLTYMANFSRQPSSRHCVDMYRSSSRNHCCLSPKPPPSVQDGSSQLLVSTQFLQQRIGDFRKDTCGLGQSWMHCHVHYHFQP